MELEFDEAKSARNVLERGLGFERFADMDPRSVVAVPDQRHEYGELRLRVFGHIDGRLHAGVVTTRGEHVRVISLRRANRREERWYEKTAGQSAG